MRHVRCFEFKVGSKLFQKHHVTFASGLQFHLVFSCTDDSKKRQSEQGQDMGMLFL